VAVGGSSRESNDFEIEENEKHTMDDPEPVPALHHSGRMPKRETEEVQPDGGGSRFQVQHESVNSADDMPAVQIVEGKTEQTPAAPKRVAVIYRDEVGPAAPKTVAVIYRDEVGPAAPKTVAVIYRDEVKADEEPITARVIDVDTPASEKDAALLLTLGSRSIRRSDLTSVNKRRDLAQ
jgi:hypothetical protein